MENSEETVVSMVEHWTAEAEIGKPFLLVWKRIFVISCVFAVLMDPLFLYIPIINEDMKCLQLDLKMKKTTFVLRSVTDLFYIVNIIIQISIALKAQTFRFKGESYRSKIVLTKGAILVEDALDLAKWIWRSHILIDTLAVLPIPHVVIFIFFTKLRGSRSRIFLNSLVLFQYVPRVLRIYLSCEELKNSIQSAFKFFTFILASHVVGALWYFFSIQRETNCWQYACRSKNGCEASAFDCDDDHTFRNIALLKDLCPINPPNATLFDFGIFLDALQSGMLGSTDFPQKFLHCFWWGLRNLSSFGQNLQTSTYAWEDLFAVFISIIGMLLFLIYLNGILQTYMQLETTRSKEQRKLMKMERQRGPEITSWLYSNDIPLHMEKMIMTCVLHKLEANKDVNIKNILSTLPLECLKFIKRHLCLETLKKVPVLQAMDEQVLLTEVCDSYLKPVIYNENSYIIQEREPIDKMLFIIQGTVRTYTTSNVGSGFSRTKCLEKGDFYGEELLNWALNNVTSSSDDLPISTRIVKCSTKVEAFTLMANDLKSLVSEFWTDLIDEENHHPTNSYQLDLREDLTSSSLQARRPA